jgi:hypothetical protein
MRKDARLGSRRPTRKSVKRSMIRSAESLVGTLAASTIRESVTRLPKASSRGCRARRFMSC